MGAALMLMAACGVIAGKFHHLLGVAPILGALVLAACFVKPRELFIIGIGGLLVRDLLTGFSFFTGVRLLGISLVVGVLVILKIRPSFRSLFTGLCASSPVFHLTLAVGDWLTGTCSTFSRTPTGLFLSIWTTIPYFQRAFLSDLLFSSLFLALYTAGAYTLPAKYSLQMHSPRGEV